MSLYLGNQLIPNVLVTSSGETVNNNEIVLLDYIESTGLDFIDTGIVPSSGYTAEIGFMPTYIPTNGENWMMSVFDMNVSGYPRMRCGIYNGSYYSDTLNGFTYNGNVGEYTVAKGGVSIAGCTLSLYLFGAHEPKGVAHLENSKNRLYYGCVYDTNKVLVTYYRAAIINGIVGVLDLVNHTFLTGYKGINNAFIAGNPLTINQ